MATICVPEDARVVWDECYAPDPLSISLKLQLGDRAFNKALKDDQSTLLDEIRAFGGKVSEHVNLMSTVSRDQNERTRDAITPMLQRILDAMAQTKELNAAMQKQTSKGRKTECTLVELLQSNSGLMSASQITERSVTGKIGGDVIVQDHGGNFAVIELKDKDRLIKDDLDKFLRDADAWTGQNAIFVFVRKDGVGTCRALQEKPLIQKTPKGRLVIWYKAIWSSLRINFHSSWALHPCPPRCLPTTNWKSTNA